MKIKDLLIQGRNLLNTAEIKNSGFEAELILAHLLKRDRIFLYTHNDEAVSDKVADVFLQMVKRREKNEPMAYILGYKEFMGLSFSVNNQVLIPRPDTEALVEFLIDYLKQFFPDGGNVLDLCIGSGAIGISLKFYHPFIKLKGSDISKEALKMASINAQQLINNDIVLYHSDLFEKIPAEQKFDIIVSNPPYIPLADLNNLADDIVNYEPHTALDGGESGLYFYEQITKEAGHFINPGGLLAFEIGHGQAASVKRLLVKAGFKKIQTIKDLAGLTRCILGFY